MEIQVFNSPDFGEIRTTGTSNEPLFCLADVCLALGLNPSHVRERLDKGVVSTDTLNTKGGPQQMLFVNEDGLYDVIFDSRKPVAKKFRKWVTSEVLPAIRKTGAYSVGGGPYAGAVDEVPISDREVIDSLMDAYRILNAKISMLQREVNDLQRNAGLGRRQAIPAQPSTSAREAHELTTTTEVARMLHTDAVTLNSKLSEVGIIVRKGSGKNSVWTPREPYSTWGLAAEYTKTYTRDDGTKAELTFYPWTQRGRKFIQLLAQDGWNVERATADLREYEKTNA